MEMISRSFRLESGSSGRKIGRSNSSLLASELESSDFAKIIAYEKLSDSMRLTGNRDDRFRRPRKNRTWAFVNKVFSFRKKVGAGDVIRQPTTVQAAAVEEEEDDRKTRSNSWTPDPNKRWPVQGW